MADAERVMSSAQASTSGRDDGTAAAPAADSAPAAAPPAVAFAKKARRGNIRKRPAEADAEAEATGVSEGSAVVRKQKTRADNPLAFTTKRPEEDKPEVFTFQSSRTLQQTTDQRATATLDIETDFAHDARCAHRIKSPHRTGVALSHVCVSASVCLFPMSDLQRDVVALVCVLGATHDRARLATLLTARAKTAVSPSRFQPALVLCVKLASYDVFVAPSTLHRSI